MSDAIYVARSFTDIADWIEWARSMHFLFETLTDTDDFQLDLEIVSTPYMVANHGKGLWPSIEDAMHTGSVAAEFGLRTTDAPYGVVVIPLMHTADGSQVFRQLGREVTVDACTSTAISLEHPYWRSESQRNAEVSYFYLGERAFSKLDASSRSLFLRPVKLDQGWGKLLAHNLRTLNPAMIKHLCDVSAGDSFLVDYIGEMLTRALQEQYPHLCNDYSGKASARLNMHAERLKDWLALHLHEPNLQAANIAQRVNLSQRQLYRVAKLLDGEGSLLNYIMNLRLQKAATLLRDVKRRSSTIEDIGTECGFASMSSFYRNFHTKFLVTPHQYRMMNSRKLFPAKSKD